MKRRVLMLITVLIALFFLASCNSSGSGSRIDEDSSQNQDDDAPDIPDITDLGQWDPADFAHVYDVGPGLTYETPSDVPWASITGSTLIRIHKRSEPYRCKWVITTVAQTDDPLVILGVSDDGQRPVITGDDAVTPLGLYYLNEARSVIKVGNYTGDGDTDIPANVVIENLDIRSGRPGFDYTNRYGNAGEFSENAASIHIEEGQNIVVRGCLIHDSANGLFTSHLTENILISRNYIYGNGIEDSIYQHNTYTESMGIIYEYNHFGPLRNDCPGNNLKDRSAGTVIRYNWIEAGNRQLDLVDTDYQSFADDPSYDATFVYGNILIEPDNAGNSQIIHYGGDSGNESLYRRGTLYLFNNTIVSTRSGNTTLIRLATDDVTAEIRNNIIHTTASPGHLALTNGHGQLYLYANYFTQGYVNSFEDTSAGILGSSGNITDTDPGFSDIDSQDFTLVEDSPCLNTGTPLAVGAVNYPLSGSYVIHMGVTERMMNGIAWDMGAFER